MLPASNMIGTFTRNKTWFGVPLKSGLPLYSIIYRVLYIFEVFGKCVIFEGRLYIFEILLFFRLYFEQKCVKMRSFLSLDFNIFYIF